MYILPWIQLINQKEDYWISVEINVNWMTFYTLKFSMMKNPIQNVRLFFISFIIVFFVGCSATKSTTGKSKKNPPQVVDDGYQKVLAKNTNQTNFEVKPNEERRANIPLDDMIRRLPGVLVTGSGQNISIKISGSESFMAGTSPLFVINGSPAGDNYAQVASVVNPNDVSSIRVLKGSEATIYGTRGANGVILINTKK